MHSSIGRIAEDASLAVPERVARVHALLRDQPDRGVAAVLATVGEDARGSLAGVYAGNYLALLPGLQEEKRAFVERILDGGADPIPLVNLVKAMPESVVDRLLERALESPDPAWYSVLQEVAVHFPARFRARGGEVGDDALDLASLPGSEDAVVDALATRYRREADPDLLKRIALVRTAHARDALAALRDAVPDEEEPELDLMLVNAGAFPTGGASVHAEAFRGYVVPRAEAPHPMGPGFTADVPTCPICRTPASRLLTLCADRLPYGLTRDPSFFWWQCDDSPLEYAFVHVASDGATEGRMTPMSPAAAEDRVVPASLALALEPHPNPLGQGLEAHPGFGNHQVGGFPPWLEMDDFPHCPDCGDRMRFLAAVDGGPSAFGSIALDGILYGFWCDTCGVSASFVQSEY